MATKLLGYRAPPSLAIAAGATTPDPLGIGSQAWSTILGTLVAWNGTSWNMLTAVSLNTVVNTAANTNMASGTGNYVYFVTGLHTLSLPSPNTNRYTVKNNHTAAITIDTIGIELIEGLNSISISPESAVDIVSNGTNWFVI